jgi:hypothetical protein
MKPFSRILLPTACVALLIAASASGETEQLDELTFVPARLPDGFEEIVNNISYPGYLEGYDLFLYCITDVRRTGSVRHTTCLNNKEINTSEVRELLAKSMRRIKMSPAIVNGETETTEFYFRIHLDFDREPHRINVYPNWGYDSETYGRNYEAPLRYDARRIPKDCLFFVGIAATPIDANGNVAGDPELVTPLPPQEPTLDCAEKLKTRLIDGKYIPAHHNGKPVAAIQLEVWGNPDRYLLDLPRLD